MDQELIKEVLKQNFNDPKTRVSEDATIIITEVIRTMVTEVALRVARQACRDGSTTVELEHVEKILPQLLLDFN